LAEKVMEHMKKLGVSGLVLASGVLVAATGIAQAEETGLADIHSWVKTGRRTCLADHFHNGSGKGPTRAQAERAAVQSWVDFTAWEYGGSWGRYAIAGSKKMTCSHSENWSCDVEARPCRSN
jgi:hypothetical protein